MAEVKWIKITTDIFDDEKIKVIDSMPARDEILVIWFKLLTLAGKTNKHGMLFLNNKIPYTCDMLSAIFNRELNTIKLALETFIKFDMIQVSENETIAIKNWGKHQNVVGLEKIKEQTRLRVAKHRGLLKNSNKNVTLQVTHSNATEEELELEQKKKEKNTDLVKSVVDYLNQKLGTKYKPNTDKTKTCISARINENNSFDDFKTVIDKKYTDWFGTDDAKYLRPETLFGSKFDGYLNQLAGKKSTSVIEKLTFDKYKEAFIWKVKNQTIKFKENSLNKILVKYPYILDFDIESKKFELTYNDYLKL